MCKAKNVSVCCPWSPLEARLRHSRLLDTPKSARSWGETHLVTQKPACQCLSAIPIGTWDNPCGHPSWNSQGPDPGVMTHMLLQVPMTVGCQEGHTHLLSGCLCPRPQTAFWYACNFKHTLILPLQRFSLSLSSAALQS